MKFLRFCLGRYDPIEKPENYTRLVNETLLRVSTRWKVTFDARAVIEIVEREGASYAALYNAIMSQIVAENGTPGTDWIEKIAIMWSKAPAFLEMFPDGRVIHIVRDLRDVTASYKKLTYEPGFTYLDVAFNLIHAIETIRETQRIYGPDRVMFVRREDLAGTPEIETRRVCKFLGIEFSEQMLDPAQHGAVIGEDWETNTSFGGTVRGFEAVSGRWHDELTRAETLFLELIAQPYMGQMGYEGSGFQTGPDVWAEIENFLADPYIGDAFRNWLRTGKGREGYRTDPYETEMRIVFPERYAGDQT